MSSLRSLCYTLSRSAIEPDYIDRWFELWNFLVPTNTTLRVNLNNGGERGIRLHPTIVLYNQQITNADFMAGVPLRWFN